MRIAINAVAVHGGGAQTYLLSILRALCAISHPHELVVILTSRHRHLLPMLPPQVRSVICRGVPRQAGLRMAWEQMILPVLLWKWKIDLLYAAYDTAVLLSPVPVVLLSHNPNPYSQLCLPWSHYARARDAILRVLGRLSARVARTVVFVSHTSAKIIAPKMRVPVSRVRVVHHGSWLIEECGATGRAPDLGLPAHYILAVSDLYPHKNFEVLLDSFRQLVGSGSYRGHLVVAGTKKDPASEYVGRLAQFRDSLPCSEQVHFVGNIPHSDLFAVYRAADLFVFPSLAETFGLPLVEAMACGTPIVTSDWRLAPGGEADKFNVGPEICGEAAEFFDPTDPAALVGAMRRVLLDESRRNELVRLGQIRVQAFSWEKSAKELLGILEDAVVSC